MVLGSKKCFIRIKIQDTAQVNSKGINITGITNKAVPAHMFLLQVIIMDEKSDESFIYSTNIYQVPAKHHKMIPLCAVHRKIYNPVTTLKYSPLKELKHNSTLQVFLIQYFA